MRSLGAIRAAGLSGSLTLLARTTPFVESELVGLRQVVRRGDVCLDIGAALGIYTAVLSRLVGETGEVHSIEPLLFAQPVLSAMLRLRRGPNIHRHTLALAESPGEGVVRVPFRGAGPVTGRSYLSTGGSDLGDNREFGEHVDVVVSTDTLDGFCSSLDLRRLDFVKADVEGAELMVVRGGEEAITRWHPTLLLEIEDRHTARYGYAPDDLVSWLAGRGYTMREWRGAAWRPVDRVCGHTRNYLFVPPADSDGDGDGTTPTPRGPEAEHRSLRRP